MYKCYLYIFFHKKGRGKGEPMVPSIVHIFHKKGGGKGEPMVPSIVYIFS